MSALALQSMLGFVALHAIAWLFSEDRRRVPWRTVLPGVALTLGLGVLFLKVPAASELFAVLNGVVNAIERATQQGTAFVFGYLGGAPLPFDEKQPGSGFILAFRAMPLVLVISALSSLLFYWRVLPVVVRASAALLERVMGVGGAVGLSAAANVFVGMVEAPIFVRPYIERMSRGELFIMMTCGMATIAGTVMVLYASVLAAAIPGALGHILAASVIATPAAIVVAALMVPDGVDRRTAGEVAPEAVARSSMDAVTRGTVDGIALLVNIIAMLVVLVALVHLGNTVLGLGPQVAGAPLSLERLLGWAMAPVVWLMGVPWGEAPTAGALMGSKTMLNEFIAYLELAKLGPEQLSERSRLIMMYALCGFANLGSLGIMIGGLTAMAPARRDDIVSLGARTLVSGTLATMIAGSVVGILL